MTILPQTEDRAVVVFHLLPSLEYGTRMAAAFGLMAAGFAVQLAMMALLPGVLLIAAGNLLLLVRGYDNRVDFATFDPTAEWERVEIERLDDLVALHKHMRRWDTSALDVTNPLGGVLFALITLTTTAVAIFARGPLQILVINAMISPHIVRKAVLTLNLTIPVRDARSASIGARAAEPRQRPSLPASCFEGLCGTGS